MKLKLESSCSIAQIHDEDTRYLNSACAGWLRGVFSLRPQLDRCALEFLFRLTDDDNDRAEQALSILLSSSDRERLLPELKRAWGEPDDLANVVWMAIGRSAPGRKQTAIRDLDPFLAKWAAERDTMSGFALARQLQRAKTMFGLSDNETELCYFLSVIEQHRGPRHYFDAHLGCDQADGRIYLQSALGWKQSTLSAALNGKLHRIGLLGERRSMGLGIDDSFISFFVDPSETPRTNELFRPAPPTKLSSTELGVGEPDLHVIQQLLSAPGNQGMHLLLYGPPGTGKTTLARALVRELDLDGLEVLGVRDNRSVSRRAALAACLEMASGNERAVVLVDEADNILGTNQPWLDRGEVMDKGWLTRVIEESGARVIWIVNETEAIDPAVMRRFSFSVEMPLPRLSVRASMLDNVLRRAGIKRHFSTTQINDFADEFQVAPAVFASAASTARLTGTKASHIRDAFHQTLTAQLNLFGVNHRGRRSRAKDKFLIEAVNPVGGFDSLATRVQAYDGLWRSGKAEVPTMAMLFHGDPGTGKSLAAEHLAELIGREVVTRRASELLGKYVGENEQKIAAAFSEAANTGAVLILDEIDTFLQPRSRAHRNWEASLVNEMLVQLEKHQGLVIATTNRLDDLDPAALRRFLVKAEFRCLSGAQVVVAYEAILSPCGRGSLAQKQLARLGRLQNMTAADLANVCKNHLLLGRNRVAHAELIGELEAEVAHKRQGQQPRIGFVPSSTPVLVMPPVQSTERKEASCL